MKPPLGLVSRRSFFMPLLISIALHSLGAAVVFWQAAQTGWSSEAPVPVDTVFVGLEDEGGTLDLIVASSRSKPDKTNHQGGAEESSTDESFVQEAHIGAPSEYKETNEPGPVVKRPDQSN